MKKIALLFFLAVGVLVGVSSCHPLEAQDVQPSVIVVHDTLYMDYFPIVDTIETSDGVLHIYETKDFSTALAEIKLLHLIHCTCSDGTINTLFRLCGFEE